MKSAKLWLMAAAIIAIGSQPATSWATRAVGATVTGEITASPSSTEIEVAHRRYHIEANSPATETARSFFLGQVVDVMLSRPGANKEPEVVSISAHVDQ
jgi:hypothetical protein